MIVGRRASLGSTMPWDLSLSSPSAGRWDDEQCDVTPWIDVLTLPVDGVIRYELTGHTVLELMLLGPRSGRLG